MSFFIKPFVLQLWPLVVSRRAAVSGTHPCAVPPAQTLSDQASIRCDSAKNKRWYLLLALAAQEVVPLPALALVCAVLLQVLQFGGGRRVVSLAGAVRSLPEEEAERNESHPILLVFFLFFSSSSLQPRNTSSPRRADTSERDSSPQSSEA